MNGAWRAFVNGRDGRRWYVIGTDDAGQARTFSTAYGDALTFETRYLAVHAIAGLRSGGVTP